MRQVARVFVEVAGLIIARTGDGILPENFPIPFPRQPAILREAIVSIS